MKNDQIKHMVDRFLSWKLPENFNPDGGISFAKMCNETTPYPSRNEPVGTNLLDAVQAEEMVRYMIEGLLAAPESAEPRIHYQDCNLADSHAAEQFAVAYVAQVGVSKETMIDAVSTMRAVVMTYDGQLREALATIAELKGEIMGLRTSWKFEWNRAEKAEAEVERLSPKASGAVALPTDANLPDESKSARENLSQIETNQQACRVLPCAFCGANPKVLELQESEDSPNGFQIACESEGCGINPFTPMGSSTSHAIAAWNRRAERVSPKADFLTELDRRVAAIHRRGGDIKDTAVRQLKEEK